MVFQSLMSQQAKIPPSRAVIELSGVREVKEALPTPLSKGGSVVQAPLAKQPARVIQPEPRGGIASSKTTIPRLEKVVKRAERQINTDDTKLKSHLGRGDLFNPSGSPLAPEQFLTMPPAQGGFKEVLGHRDILTPSGRPLYPDDFLARPPAQGGFKGVLGQRDTTTIPRPEKFVQANPHLEMRVGILKRFCYRATI